MLSRVILLGSRPLSGHSPACVTVNRRRLSALAVDQASLIILGHSHEASVDSSPAMTTGDVCRPGILGVKLVLFPVIEVN